MGKMIKPLVVVLLVLSIVSLILGSMLFSRRELLKARTQRLERGMAEISTAIRHAEFRQQTLVIDSAEQLQRLDPPINGIVLAGSDLVGELDNTKADLERTEAELLQTQEVLAQTQADLEQTRQTVRRLEGDLDSARMEIAQQRNTIDRLETDKQDLQNNVSDLERQLVDAAEKAQDQEAIIAQQEADIKRLELELGGGGKVVPRGLSGRVVAVNSYWNFVILDIGSEAGLIPRTDMLVHRGDQLIGKVHVSNVKGEMSIAEIVNDWEQSPIREGDYVLF